jgi:hypothetical protein
MGCSAQSDKKADKKIGKIKKVGGGGSERRRRPWRRKVTRTDHWLGSILL